MKFIALLCLILGGTYIYYTLNSESQVTNYQELLSKVEHSEVKIGEIKVASNMLAMQFCNDGSTKDSVGKSPRECLKTFSNMRGMCEQRIFKNDEEIIESKDKVIKIAKRYTSCVGIEYL
ncbi:hypothetical protein [Pseudoalteromonas sp. G4]|uniref:hypothetical protein n=1 Tax=Pseudoalteromonas sp. G4 TaxID=2992761 RepID=UPI00237D6510|nr:hypothetical protein [Pseudoalteromonas sp. G4]MDE3273851.1 hypothetical protein [Pseudoalteromonas sp. G4]